MASKQTARIMTYVLDYVKDLAFRQPCMPYIIEKLEADVDCVLDGVDLRGIIEEFFMRTVLP